MLMSSSLNVIPFALGDSFSQASALQSVPISGEMSRPLGFKIMVLLNMQTFHNFPLWTIISYKKSKFFFQIIIT